MRERYIYKIFPSTRFKRTRRLAKKQGLDMDLLDWAIDQLAKDIPLPTNWKDHPLKGNMKCFRECHLGGTGDWLLVYEKRETDMILYLLSTGSHTELLGLQHFRVAGNHRYVKRPIPFPNVTLILFLKNTIRPSVCSVVAHGWNCKKTIVLLHIWMTFREVAL